MRTRQHIISDIQFSQRFQQFATAYQQLTVFQLQSKREAVLNSRTYMDGLLNVFVDLKASLGAEALENEQAIQFSTLTKNGKSAAVLLTFETKFSSAATQAVFSSFQNYVKQNKVEPVVGGEVGKTLFANAFPAKTDYAYYPLHESTTQREAVADMSKFLLQFETVTVFTPYFYSLVTQLPTKKTITGDIVIGEHKPSDTKRFIYEPEGEKILRFFEVQIFATLLWQALREANLATLGSRVTTLETIQSNTESLLSKLSLEHRKQHQYLSNKKQRLRLACQKFRTTKGAY